MRLSAFAARAREFLSRLRGLRDSADIDARLSDEIRFHLDMQTAKNVANGMSADEARRAALVRFGGIERHTEATRDEYRPRPLEDALHDIRYAFRSLRGTPVFALTTILTLAIGIGANTAIFSAVDGVLLKPLPFADADRLMAVGQHDGTRGPADLAAPANFLDWKQRSRSFSALAAAEPYSMALVTPDGPEMARNWNVTEDFFAALGVRPVAGRFFEPADFQTNAARVVVISYEAWQRRFGGAADVIGKRLQLAGNATTIVGIIPRGAAYPAGREFWSPKIFTDDERLIRSSAYYPVIGRLRDGVTVDAARAEMATIAAQLAREYPRTNAKIGVAVTPMADNIVGGLRRTLWLLVGAVGLLLLVACANVANLLLTRTLRRGRELAIRAALGAGQGRVVRLLMAESFVLAVIGAAAGVVLARWGVAAIRTLSPPNLPRIDDIQVDFRALVFALVIAFVTTAVFGLVPSLRAARGDVHGELKSGTRAAGSGRGHRRARHAIVAGEVALAVVLLTSAGLLVRSFLAVLSVDRGYRAERVVMATMFTWQWVETADKLTAFGSALTTSIGELPGITAAAIATSVPLSDPIGPTEGHFIVEGRAGDTERDARAAHVTVGTPKIFEVLGIPVLRGRAFTDADDESRGRVIVINETMAQRYFPGENPVGKRIQLRFAGPPVTREIIGVVGDVRQRSLEQPAPPALFIPFAQAPTGSIAVIARTTSSPADAIPAIRGAVHTLLPDLPIGRTATLEGLASDALRFRRFVVLLLVSFALTALTLAIVGVYGLIAQSVAERTREIGVRIALGAHTGSVLSLVMRQALSPALTGIVVGLATSATATRLLSGMLYGVRPLDLTTFALVGFVILALAAIAASIPAWRATRVDPLRALQSS